MRKLERVASPERGVHRLAKLASVLQHVLAAAFERELEVPKGVLTTVSEVMVTPDLASARVGVSVLPFTAGKVVLTKIILLQHTFQQAANRALTSFRVPKLEFYLDERGERAGHILEILDRVVREPETKVKLRARPRTQKLRPKG